MRKSPVAVDEGASLSQDEPANGGGAAAPSGNRLFAKKPLKLLLEEMAMDGFRLHTEAPVALAEQPCDTVWTVMVEGTASA